MSIWFSLRLFQLCKQIFDLVSEFFIFLVLVISLYLKNPHLIFQPDFFLTVHPIFFSFILIGVLYSVELFLKDFKINCINCQLRVSRCMLLTSFQVGRAILQCYHSKACLNFFQNMGGTSIFFTTLSENHI